MSQSAGRADSERRIPRQAGVPWRLVRRHACHHPQGPKSLWSRTNWTELNWRLAPSIPV